MPVFLAPIAVHVVRTIVVCAGRQIIKHAVKKSVKQAVRRGVLQTSKGLKSMVRNTYKNPIGQKQNNITGAENFAKEKVNSIFEVANESQNRGSKIIHEANKQVRNSQIMSSMNQMPKNNPYGHLFRK